MIRWEYRMSAYKRLLDQVLVCVGVVSSTSVPWAVAETTDEAALHKARLAVVILILIIVVTIRVEARLSLVVRVLWLLLHFHVDEISRVPPPIRPLLPLELRREGDPFQSGRVLLVLSQECFLHGDVPSKPEVIAVVMLLLHNVAKEKCM